MTKTNVFALIVFLLVSIEYAAAQFPAEDLQESDPRIFRLGAGLAYSFTGYRDETGSPINRYLNTLTYSLNFNIERENLFHNIDINFFLGQPRMFAPHIGYPHRQYISARANINYALAFPLWGNDIFPGSLGGAFRTTVHFSGSNDFRLLSSPTGVVLFSLDLHIRQKWIINERNTLIFSAGFPVIGYAVRPPFAGLDERWMRYLDEGSFLRLLTLGRITSFHNYHAIFGNLNHHYEVSTLFSFYLGLGFELSRFNFPRNKPRTDAIFRLNSGITFTF